MKITPNKETKFSYYKYILRNDKLNYKLLPVRREMGVITLMCLYKFFIHITCSTNNLNNLTSLYKYELICLNTFNN